MSTISGYAICYESGVRGQELEASLESFLAICDEVLVIDCNPEGDPDGSSKRLRDFAAQQQRLQVIGHPVDPGAELAAYELFCVAPTIARRAAKGNALLAFELDDFADLERRDELHSLAAKLPFESPGIAGYALPRASYCGRDDLIDAQDAIAPCLTRNDPLFAHDLPRTQRRFDDHGQLRCSQDFAPETCLVRSDTLEAVRIQATFDTRLTSWLEDVHGLGTRALLARDQIQAELARAIEVGPAIFSTRAHHAKRALTWRRDRCEALLARLRIDGKTATHPVLRRKWSEVSDGEIDALTDTIHSYGASSVRCGRVPSESVLRCLTSAMEGAAQS